MMNTNKAQANSGYSAVTKLINRELSWIDFNERVLEEGLKKDRPPLERFKFLSIASSNFDEFFMVRVAAIKQMEKSGGTDSSGMQPKELLEKISAKVRSIKKRQCEAFINEVFPSLAERGLKLVRSHEWTDTQSAYLESLFEREIYPLLTPLRITENDPLPSIDNFSLYVAFILDEEPGKSRFRFGAENPSRDQQAAYKSQRSGIEAGEKQGDISVLRIPPALERIIWLPESAFPPREVPAQTAAAEACAITEQHYFVLLEDLIQMYGSYLYPGFKVKESMVFKVNRDADFSVDEKRDEDFIHAMEEVLETREKSMPVRMVYSPGSEKLKTFWANRLSLEENDLYEMQSPFNPRRLYDHIVSEGFEHLREKSWKIYSHPMLHSDKPLWDQIRSSDIILHLPYQSFDPVIRFFQAAASDPDVAAIKTTLYRTSGDSPIVRSLEQASRAGKHVTAVVELKARFDEGQNISWAHRLEKAGVIVVYGLAHLKIHAKATVVMRREYGRIKRYVHLSTGNYNDKTAKVYEDISLFTAREDIAYDTGLLFNMITGYSAVQSLDKLVIAPVALKRRLLDLIAREINRSTPEAAGKIMAKMNALADVEIIWALYRASQMGVKVFLNVRGICMLSPGVKGLSENIHVVSVIDHYLEHSRIYYFANAGAEELYLASADWMTRNLERRVELMFPILQNDTRKTVLGILSSYFNDNSQAWVLSSEGNWKRRKPAAGEKPFRAQMHFHAQAAKAQAEERSASDRGEFVVRRSTPGTAIE